MSGTSWKPANGFERRIKPDERFKIESRCRGCHLVVVGSAMTEVAEQEAEHLKHCHGIPGRTMQPRKLRRKAAAASKRRSS